MISTFTFKYCCQDQFKKLYGRYIRDIKKQFGKKGFEQLNVRFSDHPETELVLYEYQVCNQCAKGDRKSSRRRKTVRLKKPVERQTATVRVYSDAA